MFDDPDAGSDNAAAVAARPRRRSCRSGAPLSPSETSRRNEPGERSWLSQRVLVALCVTEIVSYGVLFYAFTVLLPRIAADSDWTPAAVTAAFSAGSLTGGAVGILTGRLLQRHGPRWLMTGGSLLGTAAILGVAWSPSYAVFFGAWVLAGAASAGLF